MPVVAAACRNASLSALLVLAPVVAAHGDTRAELSRLVGHSKAELIQRFGYPTDAITTVDGEILTYDSIDAGHVNGRAGERTRDEYSASSRPYAHSYSFRCRTEVVIRDAVVQAFNRAGNDCH